MGIIILTIQSPDLAETKSSYRKQYIIMLCQNCGKKEVTVHFTEIIDDKIIELHLCEDCAREKGIALTPSAAISELISSLTSDREQMGDGDRRCPSCGLTLKELRQGGRLGCGECYRAFEENLGSLINTLHSGTRHTGKVPAREREKEQEKGSPESRSSGAKEETEKEEKDAEAKIKRLKDKLQAAIAAQEFEKAAHLRDWIKDMESKPTQGD